MEQGSHLKFYCFWPDHYKDAATIWNGKAPADTERLGGRDQLEFVGEPPCRGNLVNLAGIASSFAPNYAPEEIFEIANKLYQKSQGALRAAKWG